MLTAEPAGLFAVARVGVSATDGDCGLLSLCFKSLAPSGFEVGILLVSFLEFFLESARGRLEVECPAKYPCCCAICWLGLGDALVETPGRA